MTARRKQKRTEPLIQENEVDSLREYAAEAEQVEMLKNHPGWLTVEADLQEYKKSIGEKLAYVQPFSKEYNEARILFIAADKVLKIVDDYVENRKRALDLLKKIDDPKGNITLDMDNQINNA